MRKVGSRLFAFYSMISLILLMLPVGRILTPVHATKDNRAAQIKQDQSASAKQPGAKGEFQTIRSLIRTDAIASAQTVNLDTSFTYYVDEKENNNTFQTAQPLTGRSVKVKGNIQFNRVPAGGNDLDFYSFSADAGDRVYIADMTQFGAVSETGGQTSDTVIELLGTDGTTILESDDDEGSFGALASTIAGATLAATGIYYIKVRHFSATPVTEILPYDLYVRLQSGAPTPEVEPNNNGGPPNTPTPLPPNGWVSGTIDPTPNPPGPDTDVFSLNLNAGDTVYLSLDANPERDGVNWNPRLGFGLFDNSFLVINDAATSTPPNSEAFFFTVREAGTYLIFVDAAAGTPGPTLTYHLSASVHPANDRKCTTYTSTNVPQVIGPGAGLATSTLIVPDAKKISNLKVNLNITHAATSELDISLVAPEGNEVVLFDDPANAAVGTTAPQIDLTLDDEAAVPITSFAAVYKSYIVQPEGQARLYWFKNQNASGTWTLNVRDDVTNANGGTLNGWGITVCEDPDLSCPATLTQGIYSSNFEADDGGFTHSGTADEWERGLPTFAPITTCHSGTNCWKTDLDNTYNQAPTGTANVNQDLVSPNISLAGVTGRAITFEWAMKYQIEGAHWDHIFVEVREVGGSAVKRVWEHRGPTMTRSVGSPAVAIQEAAGWGVWQADISEFGGKTVQLVFHMDQDNSINLAGLAIDDVSVSACRTPARADFDGDGKSNIAVFRPDDDGLGHATWYILNEEDGASTLQQFGDVTDEPVPADYDGDGDVDIAVYRVNDGSSKSAWYISQGSAQNFNRVEWGLNGDIPVPGDYDGDGLADIAVFRPNEGTWYIRRSSDGGLSAAQWGMGEDIPVQADYDGDGKTDLAVFRGGDWHILQSFTGTVRSLQWGLPFDFPVTGDYDGDRQADVAVYRDGDWYIYLSTTKALSSAQWGTIFEGPINIVQSGGCGLGDRPQPGDYDGDRKIDLTVYRDGDWFVMRSSDGSNFGVHWGQCVTQQPQRRLLIPGKDKPLTYIPEQ